MTHKGQAQHSAGAGAMPEGHGYHCARSAASTVAEGASASLLPAEFCPPLGTAAQVGQVNVWQAQSPCGFAGVKHVEVERDQSRGGATRHHCSSSRATATTACSLRAARWAQLCLCWSCCSRTAGTASSTVAWGCAVCGWRAWCVCGVG